MSTASTTNGLAVTGLAGGGLVGGLAVAGMMTNPAGWAIAGGALIGAGLGLNIGGSIGSMFGGKKAAKRKKEALAQATAIQQQREANAAAETSLQMVREARLARSSSVANAAYAGISTSSLASDATSSIGSQGVHNMNYYANDRRLYQLYSQYMAEAGEAAASYQSAIARGQLYSALGNSMMTAGSMMGTKKGSSSIESIFQYLLKNNGNNSGQ